MNKLKISDIMNKSKNSEMVNWGKKNLLLWVFILLITTLLMLFLLITGEDSLNFTLVIFIIVVKFLSGFGISMSISSLAIFIIQKNEDKFKGGENKDNIFKLLKFMAFLLISLFVYQGIYKTIDSIIQGGNTDKILDKLLFIYGIISLILSLYIKPLKNDTFIIKKTITEKDIVKDGIKTTIDKVKKKIKLRKKEYASIHIEEQEMLKKEIEDIRQHLAVFTLIFLGIGSFLFMPVSAIFIILWYKIYFTPDRPPERYEMILLLIGSIVICVFSSLYPFILEFTPFYDIIQGSYYFANISQGLGVLISSLIYLNRLFKPILDERRKQKIKDLKQDKKDLKKEKKEMKKQLKEASK